MTTLAQSLKRFGRLRLAISGVALAGALVIMTGVNAAASAPLPSIQGSPHPGLKAHGLVALPGERLLLWSTDGRIQTGSPAVGWEPIIQLPMTYAVDTAPDPQGALIAGSRRTTAGPELGLVLMLDEHGSIRNRWTVGEAVVTSVAIRPGERWALARDRTWQLADDGTITARGTAPPGSTVILPPAGPEVLCTPANLSEAHGAFPYCSRAGDRSWQAQGQWERAPFLCGDWLIEPGRTSVTVRSIDSGRPLGQASIRPNAALLCSQDTQLIVARDRIQWLGLPGLEQRAMLRAPIPGIRAAVQLGSRLALLNDAGRVVVIDSTRGRKAAGQSQHPVRTADPTAGLRARRVRCVDRRPCSARDGQGNNQGRSCDTLPALGNSPDG